VVIGGAVLACEGRSVEMTDYRSLLAQHELLRRVVQHASALPVNIVVGEAYDYERHIIVACSDSVLETQALLNDCLGDQT